MKLYFGVNLLLREQKYKKIVIWYSAIIDLILIYNLSPRFCLYADNLDPP